MQHCKQFWGPSQHSLTFPIQSEKFSLGTLSKTHLKNSVNFIIFQISKIHLKKNATYPNYLREYMKACLSAYVPYTSTLHHMCATRAQK